MKDSRLSISVLVVLWIATACTQSPILPKSDKVWLHRANRIEKARQFQYDYAGLEIDVCFDDTAGTFFVKHDVEAPSDTPLEQWCQALDNRSNLGIWFDFKNLNERNRDAAASCLALLRERYQLNGTLYVESAAYHQLQAFRDAGFLTSFYLPEFDSLQDGTDLCLHYIETIQDAIDSGVDALSGSELQYDFIKEHFPEQTLLIWTVRIEPDYQRQVFDRLAGDNSVKVLLLPIE